jgi:hypothetical protein
MYIVSDIIHDFFIPCIPSLEWKVMVIDDP